MARPTYGGHRPVWGTVVQVDVSPASGGELYTLAGHGEHYEAIAFKPYGRHVASLGSAASLQDHSAWCQRVKRSLTSEECRQYLHLEECPDAPWRANLRA